VKQRITVEQLKELTPEQQERLREWWRPEEGDYIYYQPPQCLCHSRKAMIVELDGDTEKGDAFLRDEHMYRYLKSECLPRLSIGQCIELLNGTRIDIKRSGLNNPFTFNDKKQPELIDALWQTVKEVL